MTLDEAAQAVKEAHQRWVCTGEELDRLRRCVEAAENIRIDAASEYREAVKQLSLAIGTPLPSLKS